MQGDLLADPQVQVELATMTTAEGVKHWRAEAFIRGEMVDATEWTRHPRQAIAAQDDLRISALSDWAAREAHWEALRLYAPAS